MSPLLLLALSLSVTLQDARPANFPTAACDPDTNLLMGVGSSVLFQKYSLTPGGHSIARTRAERADATASWREEQREEFTVPYFLTAWCGREGGDEVFLCGVKLSGESIVERWRFAVPDGSRAVRYGRETPALGTAAGTFSPLVAVKGDGAWRGSLGAPAARPETKVLFEGYAGPFTAADVDPEGRQVLLYDSTTKSIVRLALATPRAALETLLDVAEHPELARVSSLEFRDFGAEGRKLLTRREPNTGFRSSQELYGVLSDDDNDGALDRLLFLDSAAFAASPYADWSRWKEFWRLE